MVKLIRRCSEFVDGYRDYCREAYEHQVKFFVPTNPERIGADWFEESKAWYDKKERGEIPGQPVSFHFWAVSCGTPSRRKIPQRGSTGCEDTGYLLNNKHPLSE